MQRFLSVCALAVAILGLSQQKASAWKKFGFNFGLGVNKESADNSFLGGFYRDGPVPGSKGHGLASTITQEMHGQYPEYHGGGFNPHFMPGDFGGHGAPAITVVPGHSAPVAPVAPIAPVVPGHALPGGHGAPVPLPVPVGPQAMAPAAYWTPAQSYYWPGN
jgi:hypothetical protein